MTTHILEPGKPVPDVSLIKTGGEATNLKAFLGKTLVLYFYPKDSTPGCTIEAREFQALIPQFQAAGAEVVGVSPDNEASHCRFAEKEGLEFTLVSDPDHKAAEAFGVWTQKTRFGKTSWGIQRATFLIDSKGILLQAWPMVKPEGHAAEVLKALKDQ